MNYWKLSWYVERWPPCTNFKPFSIVLASWRNGELIWYFHWKSKSRPTETDSVVFKDHVWSILPSGYRSQTLLAVSYPLPVILIRICILNRSCVSGNWRKTLANNAILWKGANLEHDCFWIMVSCLDFLLSTWNPVPSYILPLNVSLNWF